jgi:uncharacterized protein (TIGR02246 family)
MVYRRLLALVAVLAVPCHVAAQSPAPELVRLEKQYEAAINAGDAAKLAGLFAEDAVFMPPNLPAEKGPKAIQQWHEEAFKDMTFKATITPTASEVSGDLACVRGEYALKPQRPANAGSGETRGKYVDVWKRVNGEWKLAWQIFNQNHPESPTPPAPPAPPMPPPPPQ